MTADIAFDAYGFLTDPEAWNEEVAQAIAEKLGLGRLTEDHWNIIGYVREHYLKTGAIHPPEEICHRFHLDKRCIWQLFKGPLELWKVAGLPYPGAEAYTYMADMEPPA
ncbi:MAG: sulfurtransferase TusE [Gammaproteobacteria bacterium]|nr:MAG: sulfurtransferase TusE [Gammaproteobacteria bacterium]